MAKAGHSKRVSSDVERKKELVLNFPIGSKHTTKDNEIITVATHWGDRCIVNSTTFV
jgi:hypothetical protein